MQGSRHSSFIERHCGNVPWQIAPIRDLELNIVTETQEPSTVITFLGCRHMQISAG
jgi:hypothetical protein